MFESAQVAGLISNSLSNKGIGGLISGGSAKTSIASMEKLLRAEYIEKPATIIDMTTDLDNFIAENVDEKTAAKLLADLDAIQNIANGSARADLMSSLLSGGSDNENGGSLLNLLA